MKKILFLLAFVLITFTGIAQICKGKTVKNEDCKRPASKSGYCTTHDPNTVKCAGKTKKGENCKKPVSKSSIYCSVHKK